MPGLIKGNDQRPSSLLNPLQQEIMQKSAMPS